MDKRKESEKANPNMDFQIINIGICQAAVCSRLSIKETTEKLNSVHPTGISSRWKFTKGTKKHPHYVPCPDDPSKTHYLFEC